MEHSNAIEIYCMIAGVDKYGISRMTFSNKAHSSRTSSAIFPASTLLGLREG